MILRLEIVGTRIDLELAGPEPAALDRLRPFEVGAGPAAWSLRLERGRPLAAQPPGRCVVEREGRWRHPGPGGGRLARSRPQAWGAPRPTPA